jgi:hypothetical protein
MLTEARMVVNVTVHADLAPSFRRHGRLEAWVMSCSPRPARRCGSNAACNCVSTPTPRLSKAALLLESGAGSRLQVSAEENGAVALLGLLLLARRAAPKAVPACNDDASTRHCVLSVSPVAGANDNTIKCLTHICKSTSFIRIRGLRGYIDSQLRRAGVRPTCGAHLVCATGPGRAGSAA